MNVLRALAAALLVAPALARAHEVRHEVARDRAIAVRAWTPDGAPLAGALFEAWSPHDTAPHVTGRTDGNGWAAFVPDEPGEWRVRIVAADGHGTEVRVDAGAVAPSAHGDSHDHGHHHDDGTSAWKIALGALGVLALVAAVAALGRRRRA